MLKTRFAVAFLGFAMISSAAMQAQSDVAPAAPIPSQIQTAKKVFISNGGGEFVAGGGLDATTWSGGPAQPYNEFYAAIRSWRRYELVGAPRDADLVLQISFANSPSNFGQIKLILLDPKTNIVLWTLEENARIYGRQKNHGKTLDDTINKLVGNLKALTTQSAAAAN